MSGWYKIGVDVGGTFTDVVAVDEAGAEAYISKTLTTAADPSEGVITAISEVLNRARMAADRIALVMHATTLVANAIVERKGAKTGLICTRGFRDVLEIGREKRYDTFDLLQEKPEPLVRRFLRREVTERIDDQGNIVTPLNEEEGADAVQALVKDGVASIAVCFLHSYQNPTHERIMADITREASPGAYVSLSSEIMPESREYERTSTTVANAYTQPLAEKYLSKLASKLQTQGFSGDLLIMLSNGGLAAGKTVEKFPVRIIGSGEAAGAMMGSYVARLEHVEAAVSLDMGGTTAKACFIDDETPATTTEFEVARVYRFKMGSGLPIRAPSIQLLEIGAGGGSIVHVDELGLLKVGPESSGADPGPACYGRGGVDPTVTDADLILGYLNPSYFLGGAIPLYVDLARKAFKQKVRDALGLSVERATYGAFEVVNENMANALKVYAAEGGRDLRRYTMISFGGAGPVHSYFLAEKLGIRKVICPFGAGVASTVGLLVTPVSFEIVRTFHKRLDQLEPSGVTKLLDEMESAGLDDMLQTGIKRSEIATEYSCTMRYVGQRHEIRVRLPTSLVSRPDPKKMLKAFAEEYSRQYHGIHPNVPAEVLNWHIVLKGKKPHLNLHAFGSNRTGDALRAVKGKRKVFLPERQSYIDCPVYDRYKLQLGKVIRGPAVVEERESTVVIGTRGRFSVDENLNLRISIG